MIVKKNADIPEAPPREEGVTKVMMKILVGPDDGSKNIVMRHFRVFPGGNTPFHTHEIEHVVKIEKGKGMVMNESGEETLVSEGQSLFIGSAEKHQFKNPFDEPFEFVCTIINIQR